MTRAELVAVARGLAPYLAIYEARLKALEAQPAAVGAVGPPGPAGPPGADGIPGRDGRDGLSGAPGERGEKGLDGERGRDGMPGRDGENGKDGAPGPRGEAGVAGSDGVGFDDLDAAYDGERELTLRWTRGERVVERSVRLPIILDRGVYTPGTAYEPGDAVSYGGSLWIAQEQTGALPGTTKAWRLAVKHGRDGRPGKDGASGPEGKPGRDGLDLTQMDSGGKKWR